MKTFKSPYKNFVYWVYRVCSPLADPLITINGTKNYPGFIRDILYYSRLKGSEKMELSNIYPVLSDKLPSTPYDSHYFYQDIWAAKKIYESKTKKHVDVGSNIEFVGFLTAFTKVTFVDIRPLKVSLTNFESVKGSILKLPFKSNSIKSLSCLHVAEHIGLGRYGDPLDPFGTKKACRELTRVLAKKGNLFFSVPVGKPRLCFNAHRIHPPKQILEYFDGLKLKEFSGIDDNGKFCQNIDTKVLEKSAYACGLFWFTK